MTSDRFDRTDDEFRGITQVRRVLVRTSIRIRPGPKGEEGYHYAWMEVVWRGATHVRVVQKDIPISEMTINIMDVWDQSELVGCACKVYLPSKVTGGGSVQVHGTIVSIPTDRSTLIVASLDRKLRREVSPSALTWVGRESHNIDSGAPQGS